MYRKWDETKIEDRVMICLLAGWCTKKDKITKMGLRIAKTKWENLSDIVKSVLLNNGVKN